MNSFLVLGTGQAQLDLIELLNQRDCQVYACSYLSGDVAEKYAYDFEKINITDADNVYKYVKDNGIEYIYSVGSDIAMPTVAIVANKAGLKSFISKDTAMICNTKHLLRETLGNGFEGNLFYEILHNDKDVPDIKYPFVIKPVDSQGQRGVFFVENEDDYRNSFPKSKSFSRMGAVIAEEYIDGAEISVNTFSYKGNVEFSIISDRIVWDEFPGGIIHRHLIPSRFESNPEIIARVNDLVYRTLAKLNIMDGPAYFQIKINSSGNPKLIEVTPRLDGCHMWRLIKYATGVDLLEMTIDLLMNNTFSMNNKHTCIPYELEFFCLPPDTVFLKKDFDVSGSDFIQWYYDDEEKVRRMNGYIEKCGYHIRRL